MRRIIFLAIVAIASICCNTNSEPALIGADSEFFRYGGSLHTIISGDSVILNRHSEELFAKADTRINRDKAITSSGIYIEFKSDSKSVEMLFSKQEGGSYRTPILGVYKDGVYQGAIPMEDAKLLNQSGEVVTWKIFMPIFYSTVFKGVIIEPKGKMYTLDTSKRPIYFAIGDSITHGVGQAGVSSDKTYAGVLAEAKGWELYNLAVGGSQISPSVADEFKSIKADYITVLWGYNDWNSGGVSFEEIEHRYTDLLHRLRQNQPQARIYVITPTYTSTIERKGGDTTPISRVQEIQEAIVASMQAQGDGRISTIDGGKISSSEDLKDVVHFNTEGAQRFGDKLTALILE